MPTKTTKVVINISYGGFSLTKEAKKFIAKRKKVTPKEVKAHELARHDKDLVAAVEKLGGKAGDVGVRVIEGKKYYILDYDGLECVITPTTIEWSHTDEDKPPSSQPLFDEPKWSEE